MLAEMENLNSCGLLVCLEMVQSLWKTYDAALQKKLKIESPFDSANLPMGIHRRIQSKNLAG